MKRLEGLHTVLITPFNDQNQLDQPGFRFLIRRQLENRVDGIVALGTTGETPTLSLEEKQTIINLARSEIPSTIPLGIGTGSYSTAQTIEATCQAKELGADFALIVTPYYNKPTQEGLYRHFKAIAEAVDLPICLYNVQGRTGQNLQTDTLRRLIEIPSIICVKEASGNVAQMSDVIELAREVRPDFTILSGDDALTLPLMALGGHGIFSVVSNLLPAEMKTLVDAAAKGNFESARQMHFHLTPLFKGAFLETNPIPIKAALRLCGLPSGECRLPLCELNDANALKLKQIVDKYAKSEIRV